MKTPKIISLLLFIFFVLLPAFLFADESLKLNSAVLKNIDLFNHLESLRREEMSLIRLDNSPIKSNSSRSYKFSLRDQLGRDWLFKAGASSSMDGAIAVYRISNLLGIHSPRMHYKKLEANGTEVTGSLQEIIPDVDAFSGNWSSLNLESRDYILRNHILSWLLANHHVHPDQFLIKKTAQSHDDLIRIDNSINWMLYGSDRLDIEYRTPMLSQTPFAGYSDFWNQYLYDGDKFKKLIKETWNIKDPYIEKYDLDLEDALRLTKFISLLPNDFYKDFFSMCIKNNLLFTSNNEAIAPVWLTPENFIKFGDKTKFLENIIARKESIFQDYTVLFKDLKNMRGESWKPDLSEKSMLSLIERIRSKYTAEIKVVEKNIALLKKTSLDPQKNIARPISLDLYYIMNRLGESLRFSKKEQFFQLIKEIKDQLLAYKKTNKIEAQIDSIQNAISNLEELTSYAQKNDFDKVMYFWVAMNSNKLFEPEYVKERLKTNPFKNIKTNH